MAIFPDVSLPNRHVLVLSRSGGGKSQVLRQGLDMPGPGARVLLWDTAGEHGARQFHGRAEYARAVAGAVSGGPGAFRLAFVGGTGPEDFEWWCRLVWSSLDGRGITWAVAEELSAVCTTAAKAGPEAARLLNQGRKFGLVFVGTSQKPQEIAKTYYDQTAVKWIGPQIGANVQRLAREIGVDAADVAGLRELEFFRFDGAKAEKRRVRYKAPGVF
ncbi:MAG: hypothetical protein AMXMBFR26_06960 [Porticoccaceae bacterium]